MIRMSRTATQSDGRAAPTDKSRARRWLDFFRRFVRDPLRRVDAESRAFLASEASRRPDRKVILVLLTAALGLLVQHFVAMQEGIDPFAGMLRAAGLTGWADTLQEAMWDAPGSRLNRLTWWSAWSLLVYVVVPMLLIRLAFRERIRDYGVKLGGVFADWWVYALMMGLAWPAIFLASANERFQLTYPFYKLAEGEGAWPNLVRWELIYTSQFFAVEFFFRGFLVHGLKYRFGAYGIFVMVVPYCMLHFTKPMPEALASVLGGVALGFMSLRTRSIWMGTAIHISVAWSMDAASLWRQGFFG
jgi:membrane protease YdiL (CAAX protease family)